MPSSKIFGTRQGAPEHLLFAARVRANNVLRLVRASETWFSFMAETVVQLQG